MTEITKCRFCSAPSVAIFELTSLDGHLWEAPLCIEDVLLLQNEGYDVKVKRKVDRNEERKEKESEKAI